MKFADFILKDAVQIKVDATNKEGIIREMVKSILDAGGLKKEEYEEIVGAILKREQLGSTGIGRGIAVPHTKHRSVDRPVGCVAVSQEGVDFEALDTAKVHLFFLLISPPDKPGEHLRALEHITRQLRDDTFCKFLKQSKTKDDVLTLLKEADEDLYGK